MDIFLNVCKQMSGVKLTLLNSNLKPFNCVEKMSSASFQNVIDKMWFEIIYLMYQYKKNLALNNLQRYIWHNAQLTKIYVFKNYSKTFLEVFSLR